MPVKHAIWKVGENPQPLSASKLGSEQKLEEMIVSDPRILSSYGSRIDLLAIEPDLLVLTDQRL